ncbi:MAG: hypothetical protein HY903_11715 [Deltaproteobacteria bacterium]|nr:hypothetical protein [Deltaproteobacteria bacterium]
MSSPLTSARLRARLALFRLWRLFGSFKLSVVLTVLLALYHGLLAIWARSSPAPVVQSIAGLLPFWLVYGLLLANTAVCLWRRLPALVRGAGPLGTLMFHGSFLVIALGFAATFVARREAGIRVAVGEAFTGDVEQWVAGDRGAPVGGTAPRFVVEEIVPELWDDALLFTELRARIGLVNAGKRDVRINEPAWLGLCTLLRLTGFGYAPRYELSDAASGKVLESAFVKLSVFPPGQEDSFSASTLPFEVDVGVLPDAVQRDQGWETASLNLRRPAVIARVFRGKLPLAAGTLLEGEGLSFEGVTLRFPEIRYWAELSLLYDPGAAILFSGYAMALVGLLLRVRAGGREARE